MLKKAEIDNAICNIENAGGEEVVYDSSLKRFEFAMRIRQDSMPAKIAISSKDFVIPTLIKSRMQPSDQLTAMVLFQPWFFIS